MIHILSKEGNNPLVTLTAFNGMDIKIRFISEQYIHVFEFSSTVKLKCESLLWMTTKRSYPLAYRKFHDQRCFWPIKF